MGKVAKPSPLRTVGNSSNIWLRSALGTATPSPSQWTLATASSAEHTVVRGTFHCSPPRVHRCLIFSVSAELCAFQTYLSPPPPRPASFLQTICQSPAPSRSPGPSSSVRCVLSLLTWAGGSGGEGTAEQIKYWRTPDGNTARIYSDSFANTPAYSFTGI